MRLKREEQIALQNKAVILVCENGVPQATAARILNANSNSLNEWIRAYTMVKCGQIKELYEICNNARTHMSLNVFDWAMRSNHKDPEKWISDYITNEHMVHAAEEQAKVQTENPGPTDQLWYAKMITTLGIMSDTLDSILAILKGMNNE